MYRRRIRPAATRVRFKRRRILLVERGDREIGVNAISTQGEPIMVLSLDDLRDLGRKRGGKYEPILERLRGLDQGHWVFIKDSEGFGKRNVLSALRTKQRKSALEEFVVRDTTFRGDKGVAIVPKELAAKIFGM